jgi:Adenosylmethionine-8-amino-7-oxononanoate aminotransferase
VIGSGGVLTPPAGYLEGAEELCRRHGILTIADVVIGGFGRLGRGSASSGSRSAPT